MSSWTRQLIRFALPTAEFRGRSSAGHSLRRVLGWIVLAFTVVALAACGGKKTSSGVPASNAGARSVSAGAGDPAAANEALRGIVTSRKACDLLKRPDAEAAVGQPLPQNTVNVTLGMCDYNAADFSAGASLTVGSWDSIKGAATAGRHSPEAVGGVGDEALNLNGSNGSILYVRKGSEGFLLTMNGPRIDHLSDHGLTLEKDLALKVLGNF